MHCLDDLDIDSKDKGSIGNLFWQQTAMIRLEDGISSEFLFVESSVKVVSCPLSCSIVYGKEKHGQTLFRSR